MPSLPPPNAHKDALQRHHAAQVNQHYEDIVFRGRTLRCAVTRRAGDIFVQEGGTVDQSVMIIRMAKTHFSTAPKEKETLTCTGGTWIIDQVAGKLAWEQEYVLTVGKR